MRRFILFQDTHLLSYQILLSLVIKPMTLAL